MSDTVGVSFLGLLAYNHSETERWHAWFMQNPKAFDVVVGGKMNTVRDLVAHIFQAELFFAGLLAGNETPKTAYGYNSVDEMFAMHEKAHGMLAHYIEQAGEDDMAKLYDLPWKEGLRVSSRKLLTQCFLHGVNHWGQIAMEVRQAGMPSEGPHDIILSKVMQ